MQANITRQQAINFGTLVQFPNWAAAYWEITRPSNGSVFVLISNWIPKGSLISFDNGTWFELIPQQPYFVEFGREIKIRILNPYSNYPCGACTFSDPIEAVVFKDRSDYYPQNKDKSFSITYNLTDCSTTGILRPVLGAQFGSIEMFHGAVNDVTCYKICKNPAGVLASNYMPCVGYITHDSLSATAALQGDQKFLTYELTDTYIALIPVYASTPARTPSFLINYNNVVITELNNESIMHDYKINLVANTIYEWYYQIPKHTHAYYYRHYDSGAVNWQQFFMGITLPATTYYEFVVLGVAWQAGGLLGSVGSGYRMRIAIQTNAAIVQNIRINFGFK